MSEQMSDKVWKQREVESGFLRAGEKTIQIYEDYETTISDGYAVVALLRGANHRPTKKAAALIVAAPKLLKLCQAVLREHTQDAGVPLEILEEMRDEVLNAQPYFGID